MIISKSAIKCIKKYWKVGEFRRFDVVPSIIRELRRFGIIGSLDSRGSYKINKEAYSTFTDGKQLKLDSGLSLNRINTKKEKE